MKLPHITIEYREEETYTLGKISFSLILGFGLHWAWVFAFMFNGAALLCPSGASLQSLLFFVSLAVFTGTLLCYGLFLEGARKLFGSPKQRIRNRLAAALMVFAAMLALMAADGASPAVQQAVFVASGTLSGVGSAVLLMSYGVSFSVCDLPTTAICTAASLLIGTLAFLGILATHATAYPASSALCLLLPFADFLCLLTCSRNLVDKLEFNSFTIPVRPAPFSLHVCLPSFVFGFFLGTVRMRATSMASDAGALGSTTAVAAASLLAGAIVIMAMLTQRKQNNFAFRTLIPVVAALLASVAALDADGSPYASFALFASYLMLEACMWIMYSDISQRFRISAFTVFGFGRGSLALGTLVSFAASLAGVPLCSEASIDDLATLALVALTFGVALLPSNQELRHTLKRGQYCPALVNPEEPFGQVAAEARQTIAAGRAGDAEIGCGAGVGGWEVADGARDAGADAAAGVAVRRTAQEAPPSAGGGSGASSAGGDQDGEHGAVGDRSSVGDVSAFGGRSGGVDASSADGRSDAEGTNASASSGAVGTIPAGSCNGTDSVSNDARSEGPSPSETLPSNGNGAVPGDGARLGDACGNGDDGNGGTPGDMAFDAMNEAEASMEAAVETEEEAQRAKGRFKRKCAAVADRYLLSRKETEVLYLLAKGRKSATIQECLFISEGTANTHMRHIYRKLNVHSQRELMDLVESEPVQDW